MYDFFESLTDIEDPMQFKEVKYPTNEVVAIPELLDTLQIKGYLVAIDAIGTQTKIGEKIIKKYVII